MWFVGPVMFMVTGKLRVGSKMMGDKNRISFKKHGVDMKKRKYHEKQS